MMHIYTYSSFTLLLEYLLLEGERISPQWRDSRERKREGEKVSKHTEI